jgi:HK97 family phage portal protein
MRLFGLDISRAQPREKAVIPANGTHGGGGWLRIFESYPGAWQQNVTIDQNTVLSNYAVYACISLIASDIGKLRVKLVELDANGVWTEATNPAFSPVLRKPNPYQTRNQFWEWWIISKLICGNTYVLKVRDQRQVVTRLHILDPYRVTPLIADDGSVFYELMADGMRGFTGIDATVRVPAREIIHDRFNCLFHPLIGTSPLLASGLAATQGVKIQTSSTNFFQNRSMPSGVLTTPGAVSDESLARNKAKWEEAFGGQNVGRVAHLADGMKFEPIAINAVDSQLIEQLKWTAENICSTFHVPPYKIGVGQMPTNNNVQTLNIEYYSQCLQTLIEAAEECLDEGLGLGWGVGLGAEFDIDNLLRMDTYTQILSIKEAVGAGVVSPNEGRKRLDLKPVAGGDSPYLQQQNFSLEALAKRDAQADPFKPATAELPPPETAADDEPADEQMKALAAGALLRKALGLPLAA